MVLSCVDGLFTIGDRQWRKLAAMFEKPIQQIDFRLRGNGWGAKCHVVAVIKMGVLYSWGAYFVFVPIIPILQYSRCLVLRGIY